MSKPSHPPHKTKKKTIKKRRPKSIFGFFWRGLILLSVWGALFFGFALLWFTYDLPDIDKLQTAIRKPSVTVQTQDGHIIGTYGDLYEDMVRVNDLPAYVTQAFLAIEDRRFYSHFGVDPIGLIRAAYTNFRADRIVQGGSSITQQLAKNFLFTQNLYDINDRSLRRKIQEALMAIWLEWHFSKDQILTIYLNRVYFGSGTFGIDAAARKYFGKPAKQLSVLEAAMLAGLLKAPSKYSPAHHPDRALTRAKLVLQQMVEAGFLKEIDSYLKSEDFNHPPIQAETNQNLRFFTDWIYEMIPHYVSAEDRDLIVVTTLDHQLQEKVEAAALKKFSEMAKDLKISELGLVLLTPDGAVKAMLGGHDYTSNQYNHVTQAARQAGSAFKFFIYLAGIEAGLSPETLVEDTPVSIGNWSPKNYGRYVPQGEITLEYAFSHSINAASIRVAQRVGPENIAALARRLGITSPMHHNLSIALGTCEVTLLELTTAFATVPNNGLSVWPYGILEIRDKEGRILYQRTPPQEQPVVSPIHLAQIRQLLTAAVKEGTGRAAYIGVPSGGKTGSNGDRDAWFVGYVEGSLVGGVWVGNDNNLPMKKISVGGRLPTRIWAEVMREVVKVYIPQALTVSLPENSMHMPLERVNDLASPTGGDTPSLPEDSGELQKIIDSISEED